MFSREPKAQRGDQAMLEDLESPQVSPLTELIEIHTPPNHHCCMKSVVNSEHLTQDVAICKLDVNCYDVTVLSHTKNDLGDRYCEHELNDVDDWLLLCSQGLSGLDGLLGVEGTEGDPVRKHYCPGIYLFL